MKLTRNRSRRRYARRPALSRRKFPRPYRPRRGAHTARGRVRRIGRTANVGKSSLMNAILRCERAIVTDIPGTTRDVLTERLELDGRVVRLSDTAGIRESEDAIEQIGVERARGEMEGADVVLLVIDASLPLTDADREMLSHADERCIFCLNKIDLGLRLDEGALPKGEIVRVSAATGEGMEALLEALRRRLHSNVEEDTFTAERHIRIAREAVALLHDCEQRLRRASNRT